MGISGKLFKNQPLKKSKEIHGSLWLLVGATSFMIFAVFWSWFSYPMLIPTLMSDMGLTYVEASLPMSVLAFSYMILQIPSGVISDRYKARLPIICGTLICSASSILCGLSASLDFLLIGRLLFGVGSGLCFIPAASFISVNAPPELRGKMVGLYGASTSIGGIAAFLLTPIIESAYTWRWSFIIPGIIEFIAVFIFWMFAKPLNVATTQRKEPEEGMKLRVALMSKEIWVLNYIAFLMLGVFTAVSTWAPTYLMEFRGFTQMFTGILVCLLQTATAVGMPVGGMVSDRIGRKAPFLIGFPPSAIAIAFISLLNGPTGIALCLILTGFFLQFAFSSSFAVVLEIYGLGLVGKLNGILNTFGALGASLLPLTFAYLLTITGGYTWPFLAMATVTIIGTPLSFLIRFRRP